MTVEASLKMKKPWLAGLLNLILPGLGFIYLMGIGSVIGGIILVIFTFYGNASPVFWILFGAGFPDIATWTVWALIICVSSVHIARWKNRKIIGKADLAHVSSKPSTVQSTADGIVYCPSCGTEVKSRYVFCARCGKKTKE